MKHAPHLLVVLFIFLFPVFNSAQSIKVTLLGTGTPEPSISRFGPATLIEADSLYFLFDCGRGASQRIWQSHISLGKVNKLFLTHLHSDHTVGIPDLWLTGWLPPLFGQRDLAFQVWGPPGTSEMMESLKNAYAWDIKTRLAGEEPDSGILVVAKDIREGIVYNKKGIKITAFVVCHTDSTGSALGYRLDYAGHSVVISGDTRYCENLIKFARGTDLIIHEVAVARPELIQKSEMVRGILSVHTTPEEAGKIFSIVHPKQAIYYHILLLSTDSTISAPSTADIVPRTRVNYSGPLELGEDGMTIEIADQITFKYLSNPSMHQ